VAERDTPHTQCTRTQGLVFGLSCSLPLEVRNGAKAPAIQSDVSVKCCMIFLGGFVLHHDDLTLDLD
jgi:hypothetical protein